MKIEMKSGLAGAVALAAGSTAYAGIVAVAGPSDLVANGSTDFFGLGNDVSWDVDGDNIDDLGFNFRGTPITAGYEWQGNVHTLNGSSVSGYAGVFVTYYGSLLASGNSVAGSGMIGDGIGGQVAMGSDYAGTGYGGWGGVGTTQTGFLGFQLSSGNYGWIEVSAGPGGMSFLRGAYEDTGADIAAGDVPAPASLGMLAMGAGALLRRKR
jgi:hypothetical protein